jgi:hypothetical protein
MIKEGERMKQPGETFCILTVLTHGDRANT